MGCVLAVLRLLGTSLGWLAAAGLKLTDGHLRGPGAGDEAPIAGGEREGRTSTSTSATMGVAKRRAGGHPQSAVIVNGNFF